MSNELTIKVTKARNYGREYLKAECLGIVVENSANVPHEDLSSLLEKLGNKIEDRHETLKKLKADDMTEKASAEKALLASVLG